MWRPMVLAFVLRHLAAAAYGGTREEYAAAVKRGVDAMSASEMRAIAGAEAKPISRHTVSYALCEAFCAQRLNKPAHAAKAKAVLLAVNRCALEGTETAKADQFAQMEFCLYGSTLLYQWLKEMGQLDPAEVVALLNRFRELCSPVGLIPDYGDTIWGEGWADWIAIFEWGASRFNNPDLKQAADAIFRYAMAQFARGPVARNGQAWEAMAYAWQWADDGVKPQAQPHGSLFTRRRDPYGRTLYDKLVLRTGSGPMDGFVLVNLHDAGYHGHADGGALSAFVAGGSVLLHEMGYHQTTERYHDSLLVRPPDETFLLPDELFRAGRWYTTEADLRRPFTYTGGVAPDLKRIASMFFRLEGQDKLRADFELAVEEIAGIDANGEATSLVDLSATGEPGRWAGYTPSAGAVTGLHATVHLDNTGRLQPAWLSRALLCVYDTVRFKVPGEYAVGPAWHVEDIVRSDDGGFVCRDDWQGFDLVVRWASPPTPLCIRMAGPPGTTLGCVEKEFSEWGRKIAQRRHVYARWAGTGRPGEKVGILSALLPLPDGADESRAIKASVSADSAVAEMEDMHCAFGPVHVCDAAHMEGTPKVLFIEGAVDKPRHIEGLIAGAGQQVSRFVWDATP